MHEFFRITLINISLILLRYKTYFTINEPINFRAQLKLDSRSIGSL